MNKIIWSENTVSTDMYIHKSLQPFIDSCLKLWRKPFEDRQDDSVIVCNDWRVYMRVTTDSWDQEPVDLDWYHWLFSKDSWLMEFVNWKKNSHIESVVIREYWWFNYDFTDNYHYAIMWPMTVEEKIQYFLENAQLPSD